MRIICDLDDRKVEWVVEPNIMGVVLTSLVQSLGPAEESA